MVVLICNVQLQRIAVSVDQNKTSWPFTHESNMLSHKLILYRQIVLYYKLTLFTSDVKKHAVLCVFIIATCCVLDDPRFELRRGKKISLLPTCPDWAWVQASLPCSEYHCSFKRPLRGFDHPPHQAPRLKWLVLDLCHFPLPSYIVIGWFFLYLHIICSYN